MTELTITEQLQQGIIDRLAQTPIEFHSSVETAKARTILCMECPERTLYENVEQCKACGCFIALKAQLNNATCPLNKWKVVIIPNEPPPKMVAAPANAGTSPQAELEALVLSAGFDFNLVQKFGVESGNINDAGSLGSFSEISADDAKRLLKNKTGFLKALEALKS